MSSFAGPGSQERVLTEASISVAGDTRYARILTPQPGILWRLTLSTAGASTTFSVDKGSAADSTNTTLMTLASAMSKTTGTWVAGTGNGALDTGTIAINSWYHAFLIYNPTTLATDVLISLSPTAPTLPSGYTQFRRIGSMKTNGSSQWTAFLQVDDSFYCAAVLDYNSTSARAMALLTLSVPTGVIVNPLLSCSFQTTATNGDVTINLAPGANSALSYIAAQTNLTSDRQAHEAEGPATNTSAQINMSVVINSGALSSGTIYTRGWIDTRGRLA